MSNETILKGMMGKESKRDNRGLGRASIVLEVTVSHKSKDSFEKNKLLNFLVAS